jgi:general secretion pathway protein A
VAASTGLERSKAPYHGLWTMPFRENTDPSFLWLGPPYRDAFAMLRAAVLQNAGVLLLVGEVGTGKTMLAGALAESLRSEGLRVGKLLHADIRPHEFRAGVAQAFGLDAASESRKVFLTRFGEFLHAAYARGEKVLLVIDEAQSLSVPVLEEIASLVRAGREAGRDKVNVMNILLVAQREIDGVLKRQGAEVAIVVRAHLGPLEPAQVADYIAFRLRVAGAEHELFSADAIRAIAVASGGVPRAINRICDYALQVAEERKEAVVSLETLRDVPSTFGIVVPVDPAEGVEEPSRGPGTGRRIAYAAVVALVIGAGVMVYLGGRAISVGGRLPHRDANAATPARLGERAVTAPAIGASVREPVASPPTIEPAPRTEAVTEAPRDVLPARVVEEPKTVRPASDSEEPKTARPAHVQAEPKEVRKPPLPPVRTERPTPRPAAPVAGAMTVKPDIAPPPPARAAEASDDPSAIIDWVLKRNRAAGEP